MSTEVKENSLIVELRTFAGFMEGRQKEFYNQMLKDARSVEVVRLSKVFSPDEIKAIKTFVKPQVKECYRNATLFAHIFPEVKYVEGKMTCCGTFGIEHAWNKVGEKYADITMELALGRDPSQEEYMALGEYEQNTVVDIVSKEGFYTSIYPIIYNKNKI
jgi:hypothetical protein